MALCVYLFDIRTSSAAFDLDGGPDAALLLHGLTGSPNEVRHIAEVLHRKGMRCVGPVMAGHQGAPDGLIGVRWADWIAGAQESLEKLRGARRIYLVGCSMGALVTCALAQREGDRVAAMALLAPAMQLRGLPRIAAMAAHRTPLARWVRLLPKLGGPDVRDPVARREHPNLRAVPLSALVELNGLAAHVDSILPRINARALVVLGAHDHTISNSVALRLARRIGSNAPASPPSAEVVILPLSYHLVGIDLERDRCADEVLRFFEAMG